MLRLSSRMLVSGSLMVALASACSSDPKQTGALAATPAYGAGMPSEPATAPPSMEPAAVAPSTSPPEQPMPMALAPAPPAGEPAPGAGGSGGVVVDTPAPMPDRCDVGVYDPNVPLQTLTLSGSLNAHDPVIVAGAGGYYFFATGAGISVKTSPDLLEWTQGAAVFPATPEWFQQMVPDYTGRSIWAPDVSYFGGQFHLYYSVSSFGENRSCIGHATRADLGAGEWTDHGAAFCSNPPGQNDNFNAIDPNVVIDEAGTAWMTFGSFWSGIKMIRLDQAGARAGTELYDLASRGGGAIEGPFIVRRCGYYYLFVSFDRCCQGADSTYNVRVGRAADVRGPYVDRAGVELMNGGGTLVLEGGGDFAAAGHNAILLDGTRAYNVYHAYPATTGGSRLRISELAWDGDGWPVSGGP